MSPQAEIDAMLAELNSRTRAAASPEPEPPVTDIFELTDEMTEQEPAMAAPFSDAEASSDTELSAPPDEAPSSAPPATAMDSGLEDEEVGLEEDDPRSHAYPAEPVSALPRGVAEPGSASHVDNGLISSATSAAVDSAFNTLAQTVLVQNARTLEDLVREMLRPMLKIWLDDNLPGLVERLVRAEIERVSRGRS